MNFKERLHYVYWLALVAKEQYTHKYSIMGTFETINYIIQNNCSVARFGDGEFSLMLGISEVGFQKVDTKLKSKLRDVMQQNDSNLLICIPNSLNSTRNYVKSSAGFWNDWILANGSSLYSFICQHIGIKYLFGDSLITRPYMDLKDKSKAGYVFDSLKKYGKIGIY